MRLKNGPASGEHGQDGHAPAGQQLPGIFLSLSLSLSHTLILCLSFYLSLSGSLSLSLSHTLSLSLYLSHTLILSFSQVRKEALETLSRISARGDRSVVLHTPYTLHPTPYT